MTCKLNAHQWWIGTYGFCIMCNQEGTMPDKDTNEAQTYCDDHDWWIDRGTECKYCAKEREFTNRMSRYKFSMKPGAVNMVPPPMDQQGFFDYPPYPMSSGMAQLPEDSDQRKLIPMATGLLDYFPRALAEVARVSKIGNDKHNPGEPMHHARGKSMDHADCIARHLIERGGFDGGVRHSAALAWRALALLQEEMEAELGLPLPRGAKAAT
jgi:hypothetical protein